MRDSEQEYPPHQPPRSSQPGGSRHRRPPDDYDYEDDLDDQTAPAKRGSARSRASAPSTSRLPHNRRRDTLIIGLIAGFLCIAQSIIITLVNAPTYHAYDIAKNQTLRVSLSLSISLLALVTFVISVLICLIAGFIAGKVVVQRRLAFFSGFIAGLLIYGISFLTRSIPGYPGNQQAGATSTVSTGSLLGSVAFVLILFLVWGVIAGLFSLLGGWLATRRHPYYVEE